ncbi:MAG TPA: sialidase family protein [Candidatus Limnocylindrales bacterium]|nr:sialidase family protein [Candidatus Limnocylindrales bacterium]
MPNPIRRTARLTIVALLVAACAGARPSSSPPSADPTVAPPPSQPATAAPTVEPTATPPAAPTLLERTWTLADLPAVGDVAVHTDSRWVALSNGCGGGCDSSRPTGMTSDDGITWTSKGFEPVDGPFPVAIAWNGGRVYGLGSFLRASEGADTKEAVIWDSEDGTSWRRISTIDLGECAGTCLTAETLSVSSRGVLVMGAGRSGEGGPSGIFRSDDGRSWTRVKASTFGLVDDRVFEVVDTIAIGETIVLAGACDDCGIGVGLWTSEDGVQWSRLATLDTELMPSLLQLASDGSRLVLTAPRCVDEACTTPIWTGSIDGSFAKSPADPQLRRPRLAEIGGVYVLAGMADDAPHVFASADGPTWTEQPTTLDFAGCDVADLAGGPESMLLFTTADCIQGWVGRPAQPR